MKATATAKKTHVHSENCGCTTKAAVKQGCSCSGCGNSNHTENEGSATSCCSDGHSHEHEHEDDSGGDSADPEHKHEHTQACDCGHEHEHGDGCDCGHDHENSDEKFRITDLVAIALIGAAFYMKGGELAYLYAPTFFVAYLLIAFKQIVLAVKNTLGGNIFDENFLMTIATVGALVIGEYPEAIAVMVFYRVGEYFQSKAIKSSKKSISSLLEIKNDVANLLEGDATRVVEADSLVAGDLILIKAGERIPVDGIITKGYSSMNMAALTGESIPATVETGDKVLSGAVNIDGVLTVEVVKLASESTASKIMELVENASKSKAKSEQFITKFAKIYTPIVILLSALSGLVSYFFVGRTIEESIYFSMIFLMISCPCALVISVPMGFFGGIGAASKKGVLIKGGNYLEALGEVSEIVFDKTGTLTKGILEISSIFAKDVSNEELIEIAAVAERSSNHPIAKAIVAKSKGKYGHGEVREHAGRGLECSFELGMVLVGNAKLLMENGIDFTEENSGGTSILVVLNGKFIGQIMASDTVKPEAAEVIRELKNRGVRSNMLTGDRLEAANEIAGQLGIDNVFASLLPQNKVEKMKSIMGGLEKGKRVMAVGDGINDAPLLTLADIGVSMGSLGSDAAIEASDIVIMHDRLTGIIWALDISKKTRAVVRQNIFFSILIKVAVMIAAMLGYGSIWMAIMVDVGVSILAILNSARLTLVK